MPLMTFQPGRAINRRKDGLVSAPFSQPFLPAPVPTFANVTFLADATGRPNAETTLTNVGSAAPGAAAGQGNAQVQSNKYELDGTGDYWSFADNAAWTLSNPFTVEIFGVQFDATVNNDTIFSHYNEVNGGRGFIFFLFSNTLFMQIQTNLTTGSIQQSVQAVSVGPSYDMALCWDGSSLRCYVNGVYRVKSAWAGPMPDNTAPLWIGCRGTSGGVATEFMDGRIAV